MHIYVYIYIIMISNNFDTLGDYFNKKYQGSQDSYFEKNKNRLILENQPYDKFNDYVYDEIKVIKQNSGHRVIYNIVRGISELDAMISDIDIILPIDSSIQEDPDIDKIIQRIEILIGGLRGDQICNVKQLIVTNWLYNRNIRYVNNNIILPLSFWITTNKIPLYAIDYNTIPICIEYNPIYSKSNIDNVKFYAKKYKIPQNELRNLRSISYEIMSVQTEYTGQEDYIKGVNKYRLDFTHPVFMFSIYGINKPIDKSLIKNIKVEFNDETFYDGDITTLEELKKINNINIDPIVIIFSNTFNREQIYNNQTINFSMIDEPTLTIKTEQEGDNIIGISALDINLVKIACGMMGFLYSK